MIKITLNHQEYEVEPGLSLIQAADRVGVYIPRFCYLEKLSPLGGCRMCLISLKGVPKLQTACTTPVRDGMEVITESEEIEKARKAMLEFQLAQHPLDCFYCDKATECDLQDLTFQFGEVRRRYDFPRRNEPVLYDNPLIERNLQRCVHCERCIRACAEIQGAHALSAARRGHWTEIREIPGGGECQHCGHCIDVCPVGANLDRLFTYGGRPFQMEEGETICPYCGCGCTLSLSVREGKIMRVRPAKVPGVNLGSLCARGHFGWGFVHHPDRVTRPLIKRDGKLVEVTWDEALLFTATHLEKIIREKGADAVGGLGSTRATNESNYLFQRFMRCVIGTNNMDSSARLHYAAGLLGRLGAKVEMPEATLGDVRSAETVFVIGADPVGANPILGLAVKRMISGGGTLVLADPRTTLTARFAARHLRIRPGSEVPLILALGRKYLDEPALQEFREENLIERIGLQSAEWDFLRDLFDGAANGKTVLIAGPGVTQSYYGAKAISLLIRTAVTRGASCLMTADRNNERGSCEMGSLPDRLPGLVPLGEKKRFEGVWGERIPDKPGLSAYEMLHAAREGKLSALYIMGENPVVDFPDSRFVEQALNSLEFLVVQDLFLTRTASVADVVLPAAAFAEQGGRFTNLEGREQSFSARIPTPGEARPDTRILVDLSRKMGKGFPFRNLNEVREEIDTLVPRDGGKCRIPGDGVDLPDPGPEVHWGPVPDPDYPFLLLLTPSLYRNGSMSNRAEGLIRAQEKALVYLHPEDAASLKISAGDRVVLVSRNGETQVTAGIREGIAKGSLQMAEGFNDASPRSLISFDPDPVTRTPMGRYTQVTVRKI